ncbi:MAG: TonB-dependent receptor [Candidatus Stahlbacteria bacterium]|nr:TonB-dependent receptor [Candidatus Stahlbacteria bacterium]
MNLFLLFLLAQNTGTIRGFVKDKFAGEPIEFAQVYLETTPYGDVSDGNGYYVIPNIPNGKYTIIFSYIGYESKKIEIELIAAKPLTLNVDLTISTIQLPEMKVTAKRSKFESEVNVSKLTITAPKLRLPPAFLESDLMRSIQMLPGVTVANDFSSSLYIRGSSPSELLVLLDGATVYNPFHMGGVFSSFDMEAIREVDLYLGGFPPEYGDRIGSVLAITTKQGNPNKVSGMTGITLLSAKSFLEGPLPRGSFFIGGRRTYFDKLIDLLYEDTEFPYYFYDLHAKAGFDLTKTTKLNVSGFYGDDVLNFAEGDFKLKANWGNRSTSLFLQNLYGHNYLGKTYLTKSDFVANFEMKTEETDSFGSSSMIVKSNVSDYGLRTNFSCFKFKSHDIKFGMEGKLTQFETGFEMSNWNYNLHSNSDQIALFVQDEYKIASPLLIQIGLRGDYFRSKGNFSVKWEGININDTLESDTHYKLAPRMGIKYFLTKDLAIKGFLGQFYQFLTLLSPEDRSGFTMYFWTPIFKPYKPISATHYILGIERYSEHGIGFTLEGYYKRMYNLLELAREGETPYFVGEGEAFGADIILEKEFGRLSGWLTYSLSFSRRKFNNECYPAFFEKPHNLNLIGRVPLIWGCNFNIGFAISSGLPYTEILGRYKKYNKNNNWVWVEIEGPKDGARLPLYHRLDIGLDKEFRIKGASVTLKLQILNIYNHQNILYRMWNYETEPPKEEIIPMMPFLPSLGMEVRF